jgi:sortase A
MTFASPAQQDDSAATDPATSVPRQAPRLDSVPGGALARLLAERVVVDALACLEVEHVRSPELDWDALWHAGDNAPSDEQVAGRVGLAAAAMADQILALVPESPRPLVARVLDLDTSEEAHRAQALSVRGFTWLRNIGAILVLFVAWQLWGTSITEHHAQSSLAGQFATLTKGSPNPSRSAKLAVRSPVTPPKDSRAGAVAPVAPPSAKATSTTSATEPPLTPAGTVDEPAQGALVGRIQIPAIGLSQYVVEGTSASDLSLGPGHYAGTPLPGESGNIAIAGHRTTYGAPFDHLDELEAGDDLYLTAASGSQYRYVVSRAPFAVLPTDVAVLDEFGDDRVTLTTCTPKFSASERLVVVAKLVSSGASVVVASGPASTATAAPAVSPTRSVVASPPKAGPSPTAATATSQAILANDSTTWQLAQLPVVLLIVFVLVTFGLLWRRAVRFYGRVMSWVIFSALWFGGLYFLFQHLGSLLPPNL